jgi:glyoxalase/bleomycin resistance protein/dioxygenase superfamily protein
MSKRETVRIMLWALVIATIGSVPAYAQDKSDSQPFANKVDQLGNVVPDLEPAIKWWLERGVGPWYTLGPGLLEHNEYLGKPSTPGVIIALAQVGGVQVELIQPVDNEPSAYRDFLAAGKYGLEHCGYYVGAPEYDKAVANALGTGATMQMSASFAGNPFAYLFMAPVAPMNRIDPGDASPQKRDAIREWLEKSTDHVCSVGEVIPYSNMLRGMFTKVAEGAAAWDGKTEPVRNVLNPMERAGLSVYELIKRTERWYRERKSRQN